MRVKSDMLDHVNKAPRFLWYETGLKTIFYFEFKQHRDYCYDEYTFFKIG